MTFIFIFIRLNSNSTLTQFKNSLCHCCCCCCRCCCCRCDLIWLMQNLLGTHWHNHTLALPLALALALLLCVVSYSRLHTRVVTVWRIVVVVLFCDFLLFAILFMLCCVVHYSSLHTRVFVAIFFRSALRCVPFRAGQLNSTTFDLRMFDQLLLLLLLLPDCLPAGQRRHRRHRVCDDASGCG